MPKANPLESYFGSCAMRPCPICKSDETHLDGRILGNDPRHFRPTEYWECTTCNLYWSVEDFLNDGPVDWLSFAKCDFARFSAQSLRKFDHLKRVNLSGANITDDGFAELQLPLSIQEIDLSETAITDASMIEIACLVSLHAINVSFTAVTDRGVLALKQLPNLLLLDVGGTSITSTAMTTLKCVFPRIRFGRLG